ncbi:hypothetical protein RFI_12858 [Reticulomyxa filosa]|uniref:Uncharacterized protein n=1 Tax=Reticulomyxa filosa TaxID=46433 RepID=X6NEW1_RETFI|nr:hypothetical protein RFI_12858 [Reticulomyxa filosa]|eukprot:ETO24299.1 hypothetical protein RFI_12858 [Reticulomyxa filosa]
MASQSNEEQPNSIEYIADRRVLRAYAEKGQLKKVLEDMEKAEDPNVAAKEIFDFIVQTEDPLKPKDATSSDKCLVICDQVIKIVIRAYDILNIIRPFFLKRLQYKIMLKKIHHIMVQTSNQNTKKQASKKILATFFGGKKTKKSQKFFLHETTKIGNK